jgi:uncharacterized membrane protein YdbT with pleckstrin-like domain
MGKLEEILAVDPNEKVIYEIRKHPVGVFGIIISGFIIVCLLLFFILVVSWNESAIDSFFSPNALYFFLGFISVITVIFCFIAINTYLNNKMIVTNENLLILTQSSILGTNISQINLAKIQDVNVNQEGFLDEVFGYGTLSVETAGEATNFVFRAAKDSHIASRHILEAHENYLRKYHHNQTDSDF